MGYIIQKRHFLAQHDARRLRPITPSSRLRPRRQHGMAVAQSGCRSAPLALGTPAVLHVRHIHTSASRTIRYGTNLICCKHVQRCAVTTHRRRTRKNARYFAARSIAGTVIKFAAQMRVSGGGGVANHAQSAAARWRCGAAMRSIDYDAARSSASSGTRVMRQRQT